MNAPYKPLPDDSARLTAIADHTRSLLVEAGAGSGKTAVMAGRIAMMLADGIAPKSIAAVTFTELAASELLIRVREFVSGLVAGKIPTELRIALPKGLSATQEQHLNTAVSTIDDVTCSTIHGFCQRLIKPYPVEAGIDPGASLMDPGQVELAFLDITDDWLREELSAETDGILADMVLEDPKQALGLIRTILGHMRRHPDLRADAPPSIEPDLTILRTAVDEFSNFLQSTGIDEPETGTITREFSNLAKAIPDKIVDGKSADLLQLLRMPLGEVLCTKSGSFRSYKKKTKWENAAKVAGLSKADGTRANVEAEEHYSACCKAWNAILASTAACLLKNLVAVTRPVLDRFHDYKRRSALLDFDDLIFAARDLLRNHNDVRQALAKRFTHVLVDEFQDTDPLQTEIFWRLCGDPPAIDAHNKDWTTFRIRSGALFLVGDPKQAIYRFRGADVGAYVRARETFRTQDPDSILSISTNFRSCEPILTYVNGRFEAPLSAKDQPGFTRLDALHPKRDSGPCVGALDISIASESGKPSSTDLRDGEAEAVAEMCSRLIGSETIIDRKTRERRPCRPGDIALLAPTGSDLWRYEEALERRGVPVATQAGKGLYRRQEIQDLIAITRILADRNDTLALGALLRGPLVGLTEEDLLDITWGLSRPSDKSDALPRLYVDTPINEITHPLAHDILRKLQTLRLKANSTTPYELLSEAIDVLRVRPLLLQRHRDQAERALANIDLYLSLSRAYAVQGLHAFTEAMIAAWRDETRAVEGRPDAQEEAIALYTMHASKGLEWPVVVPVNTMTRTTTVSGAIFDSRNNLFTCPIFGAEPSGYEAALNHEKDELARERIRLWYVAATRARELLVLPRFNVDVDQSSWIKLLDLSLTDLPALDLDHLPADVPSKTGDRQNTQTRERFAEEAKAITEQQRHLKWLAPSRDETVAAPVVKGEEPEILIADFDRHTIEGVNPSLIQGGSKRGLLLHKLIEEVLTGETQETQSALISRAEILIQSLNQPIAKDPSQGLNPDELAATVIRALSLPEIAALRPHLLPELPVYASDITTDQENVIFGIADAVAFDANGKHQAIVDWKSDINPSPEIIEHYKAQVRAYLEMTEIPQGFIVLATHGQAISVTL